MGDGAPQSSQQQQMLRNPPPFQQRHATNTNNNRQQQQGQQQRQPALVNDLTRHNNPPSSSSSIIAMTQQQQQQSTNSSSPTPSASLVNNPNKGKALLPPLQPQPRPPMSDVQKKTLRRLDTYVEVISAKLLEDVSKKQQLSSMNIVPTAMNGGSGGKGGEKRQRDTRGNVDVVSRYSSDNLVCVFVCTYACVCFVSATMRMGGGELKGASGRGGEGDLRRALNQPYINLNILLRQRIWFIVALR